MTTLEHQVHLSPPPTFDLDYSGDEWTCPITGAGPVPKLIEANLEYRRNLIAQAGTNHELQQSLLAVCAKSPLYFLNVFGYTYRPKMICADGIERSAGAHWTDDAGDDHTVLPADTPIITWPAQDEFVTELVASMRDGGLVLGPKSRDQGATILVMGICCWAMLYWKRFSALITSRREDLVDNGTQDGLFGKIDYMTSRLPHWMCGPGQIGRTIKPIKAVNPPMGSLLLGESANVDIGQARRVTLVVVDEASRFPHAGQMMKSLQSVGGCTCLISTPNGPGTEFSKLCTKANQPGGRERTKILTLSYADSPTHGRGREWVIDDDGSITGKRGSGYWETPAFRLSRTQSPSPRNWRENWLIDHDTSGLLVLNSNAIAAMRKRVKPPIVGTLTDGEFHETDRGRLYLWEMPKLDGSYVLAWDFAQGVEASNTVGAVMDRNTGHIVAEFVSPAIDAYEAVPIAIELGKFYGGGYGHAFLIWESNGPGIGFGREIVRQLYPYLYQQHQEQTRGDPKTQQYGWTSTPQRKELLFSDLNKAMCSGEFVTFSAEGVNDLSMWIFDDHGRIVCGSLRDETTGAQARHGDRAIAYGLCVKATEYTYEYEPPIEEQFPAGSYGRMFNHAAIMDRWD